ncbi:putative aminoacyltransferase, E1 ubiquitin-activating enzyme [Lupinus albus]|uniref:Putative aminoacyltransferase, E1 ubiquitin-activating enzyme n=1 Tax=Lupinus albus TaxID=3870 RepID=A0A6A4PIU3_LUPAL|nr:putative aminoacyltransferase, E1 ubiquitin-activating enzyme [Lupinus albus]
MDGGDISFSDKEEVLEDLRDNDILSRVPLLDAPILLFVCFHKAVRSELRLLRCFAETASFEDDPQRSRKSIIKLRSRFQFLKLAYKYHCAAEDEVIFLALDVHVKNVACTYSLEHSSTDELFESIFHFLDELMGPSQNFPKLFQELLYCIGILQTSTNQNMLKEEEQVFPLLMQKLSTKEQASLVWQFICSVPIKLIEEVLPWMVSFLSADKQTEVTQFLNGIAPMEKALQEVLVSWVGSKNQIFDEAYFQIEEVQGADGSIHKERPLRLSSCNKNSNEISSWMKMNGLEIEDEVNRVDVLHLWHEAIKKDLKEILKELHLIRNSSFFQNLDATIIQIKFFADVLIFYSNAQKTLFHPVLNKPAYDWLPKSSEQFLGESHIEDLQQLLCNSETGMPLCSFIEELCRKLELFVSGVNKQCAFHETVVFPAINKNCRNGIQERLLASSLKMMPLGLLRCVINWFSVHLSEKESRFILSCIKKGNLFVSEAFSSLLHEWFRIGYSDLDYLVLGSAQLEQNAKLLMDFRKRFHLICFLHQIHTDAEDELVFPALEARGKLKNISHAYTFDHKLDDEHFDKVSRILDKMSELHLSVSTIDSNVRDNRMLRHHHLCRKLQQMCKSTHKLLSDHLNREEIEIWPIIRESFLNREQEKIIGCMLGRIKAEILQDMIPWLMGSLTQEEQHVVMLLWSMATKNTSFDEWLGEWWDGYSIAKETEGSNDEPLPTIDPLEVISKYLSEEVLNKLQEESSPNKGINFLQKDHIGVNVDLSNYNADGKVKVNSAEQNNNECPKCTNQFHDSKKHACNQVTDMTNLVNNGQSFQLFDKSGNDDRLLKLSQDDLEMAIRRVYRDSCLDPQKKSYIIQNLLMSRWIISRQISSTEVNMKSDGQEFPGKHPSYRDPLKLIYGCKHYKRNCKLLAPCCNQLHTCIHCHNEVSEPDHSLDRKSITKMMCMKCLVIQPISATCSTISCGNLSMAKYYCRICKLFEDEREIYHCPYCNLCRVGKGLGVDYFHCMNCNACMSRSLMVHTCREKHLDGNCPICHEYIFTSCSPVKALSCGHVMHSTCFQEYTCFNYTCPICSKSLGDMQVYFNILDALLTEENVPEELSGQTQVILCNDCEKKGSAPFHWLYHKCPYCGSYNTRVL